MIILANIIFWAWCALLVLVSVTSYRNARAAGGDATGGIGEVALSAVAALALVISLAVWVLV